MTTYYRGDIRPPLTAREAEALADYVRTGSYKDTARNLGVAHGTVQDRLYRARKRYQVDSTMALLIAIGWLTVPARTVIGRSALDLRARLEGLRAEVDALLARFRRRAVTKA